MAKFWSLGTSVRSGARGGDARGQPRSHMARTIPELLLYYNYTDIGPYYINIIVTLTNIM